MTVEIKAGPTLANPNAFGSVDELRKQLFIANKNLMDLFFEHCKLDAAYSEMGRILSEIMHAQLRGDQETVERVIAATIERTKASFLPDGAMRH
ncbi:MULTISPECIES: hypothetical protein [Achromobacter]|uniref:Uncharacterized protein n=1 Tax=Achromobacter denitrificans TaxID=32002 RepID=A0A6J5I310_ACHDE|nr:MULTISPECIES: hypothetical protein [Achromobacter]QKQ45686.1 hypothetical protein FOC81_02785 [Achromobacter denitrificans]CAB3886193.1 hypothetical protein LMG1860_04596 [Achromobacter denitrificans]